jgi:hypothetical protein
MARGTPTVVRLALRSVAFHVRELRLRLPFRFGVVTLRELPLLHLAIEAEGADGRRQRGFAADNLVPKWFDKDPAKSAARNIADLIASVRAAEAAYRAAAPTPRTVWDIWREAYPRARRQGAERGLDPLVAGFGSALFERALADAAGRLAGASLGAMLRGNLLGLHPGEVHPELSDHDLASWAGRQPPATLAVRHTVGLLDPLVAGDLGPEGGPRDGLPRTLEEYVAAQELRYFKLKVGGAVDADVDRLERIAAVLDRRVPDRYAVTLDGNEQFKSIHEFARLLAAIRRAPRLQRLRAALAFIEQPLDRAIALEPAATEGLRELSGTCPLIIDESDGELGAFKAAIALGYRGVSTKNCKGIVKSFLNRTLVERLNRDRAPGDRLFMTAEDLTNVPVVPLQQDLATVRALGLEHAERNGHHYLRGLAHCSRAERAAATSLHADLYRGDADEAWLRIEGGRLQLGSLEVPGYGIAFDPDPAAMTPLEAWPPPVTAS